MQFNENDLHDAMKITLEALIDIVKTTPDPITKGNAAINLAGILFDIYDRQHASLALDDVLDMEDDYDEED